MAANKSSKSEGVAVLEKRNSRKNATLVITNGCFAGLEILLRKKRMSLGRDINCDICLDDPLVSNEHAVILKTEEGFVIEDLNSRNGTTLNRREIHRRKLRNGDMITIGEFQLKFSC